jgi:hypothetical protein
MISSNQVKNQYRRSSLGQSLLAAPWLTGSLLAVLCAMAVLPARAADMNMDMTDPGMNMNSGEDHGMIPAGVYAAGMVPAGKVMFDYTPMFMHMQDNYIGSSTVSPQTIVTTIPSNMMMNSGMMGMMKENYRVVPSAMDVQMNMLHAMFGFTDRINLMVMASYQEKTMRMTTFAGASGTQILGSSKSSVSGLGDTSVNSLWRVYQGPHDHLHIGLGLSLPTGSATQSIAMLSPMGSLMTMRASYGMQLGNGTVDLLPGVTYTGHRHDWSWGAAYRGRLALDDNAEHYHYGAQNELTGWGGYSWIPGFTTTARIDGAVQDRIHGADPQITGLMQGTNPRFYGGTHLDLLGGFEIAGKNFGLNGMQLAVEVGGPVYQNLNGPQLGRSWQVNVALGAGF